MDTKIREYFAGLEVFDEDAEQSPTRAEVDALQRLVLGSLSSEEAAAIVTRRAAASPDVFVMRLRRSLMYAVINQTAVTLPPAQQPIVDLLKSIRALYSRADASVGRQVWADLDGWMVKLADLLEIHETSFLTAEDDSLNDVQAAARDWCNAVAFTARLTATRDPVIGDLIFFRKCFGSVVRALDTDYSPRDRTAGPDIVAAARLFVWSGPVLRERCQAGDLVEDYVGAIPEGRAMWSEDARKLSLARWEHWRRRWGVITEDGDLPGEVRELAREALEAMK